MYSAGLGLVHQAIVHISCCLCYIALAVDELVLLPKIGVVCKACLLDKYPLFMNHCERELPRGRGDGNLMKTKLDAGMLTLLGAMASFSLAIRLIADHGWMCVELKHWLLTHGAVALSYNCYIDFSALFHHAGGMHDLLAELSLSNRYGLRHMLHRYCCVAQLATLCCA